MSKRKAEETNGSPTKKANSLDDFTSIFDELIAHSYTREPFIEFAPLKSLYPERFSFAQLREHPAAVFIP